MVMRSSPFAKTIIGTSSTVSLKSSIREIFVFNVDAIIKEVNMNSVRVFNKAILDKVSHPLLMDSFLLKATLTAFMPQLFKELLT